ncbi:MAG: redox-sensing transcriptional repressor Rex [Bacteroidales bacterium]|nr:redox-sensing transcriptional repressor Rex [Bacteroidales bacterium]MBN2818108.1 redox-sensing transcriptional repressor Rex [Bacteroidales bacterium]
MKTQEKDSRDIVPEPTVKRLPLYLHFLKKAKENGVLTISAPIIGQELEQDPTQVVKDLAYTGVKGRPRVGYNIYELIKGIEEFLGFNQVYDAFLVGAGNLGSALINYPEFRSFGFKIIAAFDISDDVVGTQRGDVNVLHFNVFKELASKLKVRIGILTTPAKVAQEVAEQMAKAGIRAIWNFTPVKLKLPEGVIVQNTSMYSNVAVLVMKLNNQLKKNKD